MTNDTDLDGSRVMDRDATSARVAPSLVPLPELGVIAVEGADAVAFLQAQLTNDVTRLTADRLQLNGYCTAKGRLLATFHAWRDGETVLLQLPREILPAVMKRLSMFVLRAKAKLTDASERWTSYGVIDGGVGERKASAGISLPVAPWSGVRAGDVRIFRVPPADGIDRLMIAAPPGVDLPAWCASLDRAPASLWWWSEIAAAIPTVFAATQEKFVPQMINFEVVGGVDFRKGCYPGQEIVARSQYLGKLKRRMQRGHVQAANVIAGADVYQDGAAQPIGTIVMAAPEPGGGTALLLEAPADRLAAGALRVDSADGAAVSLMPLPYVLFDPTA